MQFSFARKDPITLLLPGERRRNRAEPRGAAAVIEHHREPPPPASHRDGAADEPSSHQTTSKSSPLLPCVIVRVGGEANKMVSEWPWQRSVRKWQAAHH